VPGPVAWANQIRRMAITLLNRTGGQETNQFIRATNRARLFGGGRCLGCIPNFCKVGTPAPRRPRPVQRAALALPKHLHLCVSRLNGAGTAQRAVPTTTFWMHGLL